MAGIQIAVGGYREIFVACPTRGNALRKARTTFQIDQETTIEIYLAIDAKHNSEYNGDNIVTEYEKNFSEKGFKINRVVAYL